MIDLRRHLAAFFGEARDDHKGIVAIGKPDVQALGYLVEFVYHFTTRKYATADGFRRTGDKGLRLLGQR